ncbi:hypothetical protein DQ239_19120 [Blastococcus sp. TF02-09]|uniref:hypothetical protein n=1 Tax=Blastococcus sp. TF02-09 TaxID=2250576 RepID=UPI000DEA93C9|nr:hypothetical protein [Blastococcus sp. TF02-9]RBY74706.1 hypothetical protein DQ239_19120 [Blastococcus sp. TF02-9]
MSTRHRGDTPTPSRVGTVLFALATACGLWFGITAPDVSPVAPPGSPGAGPAPVAGTGDLP